MFLVLAIEQRYVGHATRPNGWCDHFPVVNITSPKKLQKTMEKFSYLLEGFTKK